MEKLDYKYTKDGKKVAVIGKLNAETWIVQEVFVSNGQEYPAGENFTEKTLLDEPAETWNAKRKKELESQVNRLTSDIEHLDSKVAVTRRKGEVARLINRATEKYQDIDIEQLDTLFAFMSGEITHLVIKEYSKCVIVSLIDGVEAVDSWYNHNRLEGLRLVSLFGCRENTERDDKDRSFSLNWRINQYRDNSGNWRPIYPCKSYEKAVEKLDDLIADEDATDALIQLKEKYSLANPTAEKIEEYRQRQIESKKKKVVSKEKELENAKIELLSIERNKNG